MKNKYEYKFDSDFADEFSEEELVLEEESMTSKVSDFTKIKIDDPVFQYLQEIGRYPLLSPEEEIKYVKLIEQGDQAAKEFFINCNLRLVVSIAKRYIRAGMLQLDLIQEGNLGLIKAVEKFDLSKGNKFSTYATWWIRQAIITELTEQSRTIKISGHTNEKIYKIRNIKSKYYNDFGIEATAEEVAKILGTSVEYAEEYLAYDRDLMCTVSLDKPVTNISDEGSENSTFGDYILDDLSVEPAEVAINNIYNPMIWGVLINILTLKELMVLKLRFGYGGKPAKTLEDVGKYFGVTRERIRQIENKALKKLRRPSVLKQLETY